MSGSACQGGHITNIFTSWFCNCRFAQVACSLKGRRPPASYSLKCSAVKILKKTYFYFNKYSYSLSSDRARTCKMSYSALQGVAIVSLSHVKCNCLSCLIRIFPSSRIESLDHYNEGLNFFFCCKLFPLFVMLSSLTASTFYSQGKKFIYK